MDEMERRAVMWVITKGTRSVLSSVEVSWGVSASLVSAKLEHLGQLPENTLLVTLDVYRSRYINRYINLAK